jgi:ATP-dependent RNA helicase MSS116
MLNTTKSRNTLKSFSLGVIYSSNLYCTSLAPRLLHPSKPLCKHLYSTFQTWEKIPKSKPEQFGNFNDLNLHKNTQIALEQEFGFREMSQVQQAVLSLKDQQNDLLVKAKTGTGKTLAFMIAAIEKVLKDPNGFQSRGVSILVLSPTRELAMQISNETVKLAKFHTLSVHAAVGGMSRDKNVQAIGFSNIDILIGTPGRINDLMINEESVQNKLKDIKVLVFDEADQLLDMGFKREIENIKGLFPPNRTTFMFSATLSKDIKEIASKSLKPGYIELDLVPKNQIDTHKKIKQSYTITPFKDQMYMIHNIISKHRAAVPNSKIIIFFPATAVVQYTTEVFNCIPGMEFLQIHSKMDQRMRTRVSNNFRRARSAILCTTDVSARGVDYPGVTLVLQIGVPSSREQYIHRIGRTGRADNKGEAILVLSPYEEKFLKTVNDLPIRKNLDVVLSTNRNTQLVETIMRAIKSVQKNLSYKAFIGMFGFHLSHLKTTQLLKYTGVELTRSFCIGYLHMNDLPTISPKMAQNLGVSSKDGANVGTLNGELIEYIHKPSDWSKKEFSIQKSILSKLHQKS